MHKSKVLEYLKSKEVSNMFDKYWIIEAYVFWSYSRWEQTKSSDLDLLIKNDRNKYKMTIVDYVNIEKFLKNKIWVSKVDIWTKKSINKIFMPFIKKDLVKIK